MNLALMGEHLADAEKQLKLLHQVHKVATRMRQREIGNQELSGCGLYFPKTSDAMLAQYDARLDVMQRDNKARSPVKVRPGPSETPAAGPKETTRRRRKRN